MSIPVVGFGFSVVEKSLSNQSGVVSFLSAISASVGDDCVVVDVVVVVVGGSVVVVVDVEEESGAFFSGVSVVEPLLVLL